MDVLSYQIKSRTSNSDCRCGARSGYAHHSRPKILILMPSGHNDVMDPSLSNSQLQLPTLYRPEIPASTRKAHCPFNPGSCFLVELSCYPSSMLKLTMNSSLQEAIAAIQQNNYITGMSSSISPIRDILTSPKPKLVFSPSQHTTTVSCSWLLLQTV